MLRFISEDVVWQEVPGQVSLAYAVAGCPLRCPGCHSADSWNPGAGLPLTPDYLDERLRMYRGLLTCVLFFGGEWRPDQLEELLIVTERHGLFRCLYTGLEDIEVRLRKRLTFLKTGPWIREKGGLDCPSTNQRFVDLRTQEILNHHFHRDQVNAYTHTIANQSKIGVYSELSSRR